MSDKFKAFSVTIRPKNGWSCEWEEVFLSWVRKHCDQIYAVVEKHGTTEAHMHCGYYNEHGN